MRKTGTGEHSAPFAESEACPRFAIRTYEPVHKTSFHHRIVLAGRAGVMDKQTIREFNEFCLTPVQPLRPKEIRALGFRLSHDFALRRYFDGSANAT
jgi:hypothetical protein